ncbi:conserved membrane hypothetical protein [Syntrophobacter sp. SbD1]|nr:conserved membrane hypothetical protein [Syntrophobacter sp. SbD1]
MMEILAPLIVGLTGSLHCLGMCGPLILAWSLRYSTASLADASCSVGERGGVASQCAPKGLFPFFSGAFPHHLAYHAGRITTYGILGAVVAGLFHSLEVHRFAMQYKAGFAIAAGIILIGLGLVLFGTLPLPGFVTRLLAPQASLLGRRFAKLAQSESLGSKAGLGFLAGLLPCGLSWAMLVAAASTLSPTRGLITMAAFGLGTVPALLVAGMSVSFLSARTRLLGERTAAVFIVLMGVSLAVKGLGAVLGFGGHCCPIDLLSKTGLLTY